MRERERREKEREMTSRESLKELFSITDNKFSLYLTLYTEREREREREREKVPCHCRELHALEHAQYARGRLGYASFRRIRGISGQANTRY